MFKNFKNYPTSTKALLIGGAVVLVVAIGLCIAVFATGGY